MVRLGKRLGKVITMVVFGSMIVFNGFGPPSVANNLLAAAGSGQPAAKDQPKIKLIIAYGGSVPGFSPIWIAKEAGFFDKYGLEVTLEKLEGDKPVTGVVSKACDFGATGGNSTISANAHGANITLLAQTNIGTNFAMFVQPHIVDIKQLKTLAIDTYGSPADLYARMLLNDAGINPAKDLQLLQTGAIAQRVAALLSKQVDGAMVVPPQDIILERAGFKKLLTMEGKKVDLLGTVLMTRKDYIQKNPQTVDKVLRALVEAIHYEKTNKDGSIKIMAKYLSDKDPVLVEATWKSYSSDAMIARVPYVNIAGVKVTQAALVKKDPTAGSFDATTTVDSSFLKKIEDSGLTKKLYGN